MLKAVVRLLLLLSPSSPETAMPVQEKRGKKRADPALGERFLAFKANEPEIDRGDGNRPRELGQ